VIQPDYWARYLVALRNTIANDLRPHLDSDLAKDQADHAVLVLNRMITDVEIGPELARLQIPRWVQLHHELARITASGTVVAAHPAPPAASASLSELDEELTRLQQFIARRADTGLLHELAEADSKAADWFARSATAALNLLESYESRLSAAPAAALQAASVNPQQICADLSAYLRRRFPRLPPDPIDSFRVVPGGRAKRTAIFALKQNAVLPQRLVLRSDAIAGQTGTTVADEFALLTNLQQAGLPVPQPHLVERDVSVLGGTFMIVDEIENALVAGEPFAEERRLRPDKSHMGPDFGRQLAQFLALLHSVPSTAVVRGAHSPSVDRHEEVRLMYQQWQSIERPPRSIGLEFGFLWLLSHALPADRPRCLVHGDFGCHNILTRNGDLVAVLDWELAHEDDPAADFGDSKRMLLDELLPWQEFVKHYVAAGGDPRACDPDAVRYFSMWRFVKHGAMTALLRHLFLSGARDDILAAGASWHFFHRLQQYCARELADALEHRGSLRSETQARFR